MSDKINIPQKTDNVQYNRIHNKNFRQLLNIWEKFYILHIREVQNKIHFFRTQYRKTSRNSEYRYDPHALLALILPYNMGILSLVVVYNLS